MVCIADATKRGFGDGHIGQMRDPVVIRQFLHDKGFEPVKSSIPRVEVLDFEDNATGELEYAMMYIKKGLIQAA